jgi:anti-sigma factor RsiW
MDKRIRKLLYRSFDGSLTPEEQRRLEESLVKSKSLREEKQRLEDIRRSVASSTSHRFEPFFAERVMRRIRQHVIKSRQVPFSDALLAIFRPVVVGAVVLVIGFASYNMIRKDRISLAAAFAEPEVTLEEAYDPTLILEMER